MAVIETQTVWTSRASRVQWKGQGEGCRRLFMGGSELLSETNLFFVQQYQEEHELPKQ